MSGEKTWFHIIISQCFLTKYTHRHIQTIVYRKCKPEL